MAGWLKLQALFNLLLCADELVCDPFNSFKSGVSVSYSPQALLDVNPAGFQSQLWGFVFPVLDPGPGVPSVEPKPLILRGDL